MQVFESAGKDTLCYNFKGKTNLMRRIDPTDAYTLVPDDTILFGNLTFRYDV
jgi:hypothetical protein